MKKCTFPNCDLKHSAKGMCIKHYRKKRTTDGKIREFSRRPEAKFSLARRRALRKGSSWDLTLEQYLNITDSNCLYCAGNLPETGSGLDRADNNKGYSLENAVPCCTQCNRIKSNIFDFEDFKEFTLTELFKKVRLKLNA